MVRFAFLKCKMGVDFNEFFAKNKGKITVVILIA